MPGHPQPPVDPAPACSACGAPVHGRFCGACGAARPASPTRDAQTTGFGSGGGDAPTGAFEPGPPTGERAAAGGWGANDAGASSGHGTPAGGLGSGDGPAAGHPTSGPDGGDPYARGAAQGPYDERRAWAPLPPLSPSDPTGTGGGPAYTLSPSHEPEPERRRQWPVIAALVVALLAVGGGVWWVKAHDRPESTATSVPSTPPAAPTSETPTTPAPTTPTATPTTTSAPTRSTPRPTVTVVAPPPPVTVTPTPSTDPNAPTAAQNAAAEEQLAAQRAADATRFDAKPHVIAQLSSKHDGTVDPKQPTARGTTRWTSVDILAQYQQMRDRYGDVLLLRGTDLGSTNDYRNDWVTIYDPGTFTSVAQAQRWCDTNLPGGKNACYPSTTKG